MGSTGKPEAVSRRGPRPAWKRAAAFVVVATALLAPVYLYIGARLVTGSELPEVVATLCWAALFAHLVLLPVSL